MYALCRRTPVDVGSSLILVHIVSGKSLADASQPLSFYKIKTGAKIMLLGQKVYAGPTLHLLCWQCICQSQRCHAYESAYYSYLNAPGHAHLPFVPACTCERVGNCVCVSVLALAGCSQVDPARDSVAVALGEVQAAVDKLTTVLAAAKAEVDGIDQVGKTTE